MIFKRRDTRLTLTRFKNFFIPRKGWRRAVDYIFHRVKRLPDSPHKIAIGLSIGVFCSFTPFFGLHIFLAALLAYLVKGNIVAALLGTFFGNPLTWPFIAAFSVKLGQMLLGYPVANFDESLERIVNAANAFAKGLIAFFGYGESNWTVVYRFLGELFVPYFFGGLVLGLMAAIMTYFIFRPIIYAYKIAKLKKKTRELKKKGRVFKVRTITKGRKED